MRVVVTGRRVVEEEEERETEREYKTIDARKCTYVPMRDTSRWQYAVRCSSELQAGDGDSDGVGDDGGDDALRLATSSCALLTCVVHQTRW
jgi:hypothetical protein